MFRQFRPKTSIFGVALLTSLAGCAIEIPSSGTVLNEDQMIDLMEHPKKWHRQRVTVRIYPYDLRFGASDEGWTYTVCFEPCERAAAERSVFLVRTTTDRSNSYTGDRAAIVRARYNACNVDYPCADLWAGFFTEIEATAE
jgi:hypothetical protein